MNVAAASELDRPEGLDSALQRDLAGAVERLEHLTELLRKRLNPILRSVDSTGSPKMLQPVSARSLLHDEVASLAARLGGLADSISDLTVAIDLT